MILFSKEKISFLELEKIYDIDKNIYINNFNSKIYISKNKKGEKFILKIQKLNSYNSKNIINEINVNKKINHDNIIKFYDYYILNDDRIVFVLEYFQGMNLKKFLQNNDNILSEEKSKKIIKKICKILIYLHDNKIIYGDIKPENILINNELEIKICDFGSSVILSDKLATYRLIGTYDYLSPELILKKRFNELVDSWSLGILLHEILLGYKPFEPYYDCLEKELYFDSKWTKHISKESKILISKLLKIDINERENISYILNSEWLKNE